MNSEDGFYFYYSLLDNDVTNETFYELMAPSIPTERASVRIHTTIERLDGYLKRKKNLQVSCLSIRYVKTLRKNTSLGGVNQNSCKFGHLKFTICIISYLQFPNHRIYF